ncbi:MAG: hypothetical protein AB2551_08345 [Candidatus Thiodiazotropha sp.]
MINLRRLLMSLLVSLSLCPGIPIAEQLKPSISLEELEFLDQFDRPHKLDKQTKMLFFANSKHAGSLMNNILSDVPADHLIKLKKVYIADISGMPSLVTYLFVLPKIKDIKPPIYLVKEPEQTAWLPRAEDKVTVVKLANGKVEHISFTRDETTLKRLLDIPPTYAQKES